MEKYDLVVIGSGPAGEKAAIQAAHYRKKVCVVESRGVVGGVCVHTGTMPSKTLRETVLYLSGMRQRTVYGVVCSIKSDVTVPELMYRTEHVIQNEIDVIQNNLMRNGITVVSGRGRLLTPHQVEVTDEMGSSRVLETDVIIIAAGSRPYRHPDITFDNTHVFDGETILKLDRIPRSMIIVGGGVIGCEYACIFAHLGVRVTVIESKQHLLPFLDREISETLTFLMRKNRIKVILGDHMQSLEKIEGEMHFSSKGGRKIIADKVLFALGRVGNTKTLGVDTLGIKTDKRGLIEVNEHFQTNVENVYAVGDIIGFPSLASVSMDQGRLASQHAFENKDMALNKLLPYGIYTIPEVSIVGETEESLTRQGIPYETGTARFYELARGQIAGDHDGELKLIFSPETKKLFGVHIIGEGATDLIHIGQAVMSFGGTIDYFIKTVFNFPTMSEAYKLAALNGLGSITRQ